MYINTYIHANLFLSHCVLHGEFILFVQDIGSLAL